MARTSHALVEIPSRAEAFSTAVLSDSGRRRLIRAESSSPAVAPAGSATASTNTSSGSWPARRTSMWPEGSLEGSSTAACDLGRLLVAELGQPLQVFLDPLEHDRQVHGDITMTSLLVSVKRLSHVGCVSTRCQRGAPVVSGART